MDIKSLERDELVDLTAMLGARLARSVENELMAEMRARRLERALDGARKEVFWENRAKQLSDEIQGWQDKTKQAKAQAEGLEKELIKERAELTKVLKQMENLRSAASISDMNARRAMREEKEAKDKLERMKQQRDNALTNTETVRAKEREECAMIVRKAAIEADTAAQSNILMGVVNEIKKRSCG